MNLTMNVAADVLRKALKARKHAGIGSNASIPALALQGLPYLLNTRARPPRTIYWNVNSVCNLHCKMCDVGTFNEESNFYKNLRIDRKLHEIDLGRWREIVDEVAPFAPVMAINGTEPLMYKPLVEAVAYARGKGLEVAVTTGGYNLPERAADLARAGLSRLNVSIDGPPDLHNTIRGRKNLFDRVTSGVVEFKRVAKSLGHETEVLALCTISNLNYDRIEEFHDAIAPFPVDRISFNQMTFVDAEMAAAHNVTWGGKYAATVTCLSDEVNPRAVDVDVLFDQVERILAKGGDRVTFLPYYDREQLRRYYHSPAEFMGSLPCMSTWFFAQVMADGEVIPFTRCYNVKLGNINERAFMDIWNGPAAHAWRTDLREQGRFPACTRCPLAC